MSCAGGVNPKKERGRTTSAHRQTFCHTGGREEDRERGGGRAGRERGADVKGHLLTDRPHRGRDKQ